MAKSQNHSIVGKKKKNVEYRYSTKHLGHLPKERTKVCKFYNTYFRKGASSV